MLPARKLAHDIRDFAQQVTSTCHLLLAQTEEPSTQEVAHQLLARSRGFTQNVNALLEETVPMKTPPLKVMVVEDDQINRDFITTTLRQQGHKVVALADNGNDMVDLALNNGEVDLIVFDIHLPGQDGLDALEQITQAGRCIPAVAITGDKDMELADRAAEQHVMSYLIKPVEPVQLVTALRVAWAKGREFQTICEENVSLQANLDRRKTVDRAKALLVRRNCWNEDQAFRHLQKYSMDQRIPLLDVARMVLEGKAI